MINWFNMPEEGLSNGGQFEIKELTATENKTYEKAGEVYNKVTVNVEGGGGSSDFSTAEVTIINNSELDFKAYCPNIHENTLYNSVDSADMSEDYPFDVVLYKGEGKFSLPLEIAAGLSATGNIEVVADAAYITGAGTITVTDPK